MNNIKRIVLTGGPCAGKTTALVRIREHFSSLGYKVFTVQEVPTMITQTGWNYLTDNKKFYYEGRLVILQMQLALEDSVQRMAETVAPDKPCVIICDRGTMDISTYISHEIWEDICGKVGYTTEELRNRYDAVLHLVTAADGAEEFYTIETNANRYEQANEEGLKIARMLDHKVFDAWFTHPHVRVIDNSSDFDLKLNRVLTEISQVLELPLPVKEERKYIVELAGELPECIESEIVQTYLVADPGRRSASAPPLAGWTGDKHPYDDKDDFPTGEDCHRTSSEQQPLRITLAAGRPLPCHDTQAAPQLYLVRPVL